ncbi:Release factor glutamine methyltransferase [Candidatus Entotheonellaceae bacterium PAL068K]
MSLHCYDTTTVTLTFPGQRVQITKIADLDELVDSIDPIAFAEDERLPYWAELWPSAVALAHYTTQHLGLRGRRLLELGCGLGLVGVVAGLQGAHVLCTDYEPDALVFARHNAHHNACRQVRFRLLDWRRPVLRRRYDYIVASDVIYEARNFGPLVAVLQRNLARGGTAVFSEPGRVNAVPFFTLLRQRGFTYQHTMQPLEWEGSHRIVIYTIRHRQSHMEPEQAQAYEG